jgi:hypothetical protein
MLSMFFGNSADFSASVTVEAGSSKIEPGHHAGHECGQLLAEADRHGRGRGLVAPLRWHSLPDQRRAWPRPGKRIGSNVWTKAQAYFNGTASQPT